MMQAEPIRGVRTVVLIMTGVMVAEAYPLVMTAIGPAGPAALARMLGWNTHPISPIAWLMAAAVAAAYVALSMKSLPYIRLHARDLAPIKLLALPFAFVTGTFEELFFRKWLMDIAKAHGSGAAEQVILSAIAFGFVHAVWGALGGSLTAAAKAMLFTSGLGFALALVYLVAARQVAPAAWSHIVINLIIEPWLLLGVMALRSKSTSPVTSTV